MRLRQKIVSRSGPHAVALFLYGMNIGISYQIMDDVLDLISSDDQQGEPAGNSTREGHIWRRKPGERKAHRSLVSKCELLAALVLRDRANVWPVKPNGSNP